MKDQYFGKRDDLIGEHSLGDAGQLILLFLFMIIWIVDSFVIKSSTFLVNKVPFIIRFLIALPMFIYGGFLAQRGMRVVFGQVRTEPEIISESVFKIVRHPIYLGAILFYVSMSVLTMSLFSMLMLIFIILFYYFIAKHEENLLIARFGDTYREYMKQVPMLIPGIKF